MWTIYSKSYWISHLEFLFIMQVFTCNFLWWIFGDGLIQKWLNGWINEWIIILRYKDGWGKGFKKQEKGNNQHGFN